MRKIYHAILMAASVVVLGGVSIYTRLYDLDKALQYPEQSLGFVWKDQVKNNPKSCLAESNPQDYAAHRENYLTKTFCKEFETSLPRGPFGPQSSRTDKLCKTFTINKD